ncbi:MAG: LptE family protein [bacterium]
MNKLIIMCLILSSLSINCGYVFHSVLPSHIKTICINTFQNKTTQYNLDNLLTESVIKNFTYNPQLKIAEEKKADGVLEGEIISYLKEEISFTENQVKEYRITILANVKFRDLVKDKIFWEEKNIEGKAIYSSLQKDTTYFQMISTEEEAIKESINQLSQKIVNRTISGW